MENLRTYMATDALKVFIFLLFFKKELKFYVRLFEILFDV